MLSATGIVIVRDMLPQNAFLGPPFLVTCKQPEVNQNWSHKNVKGF